MLTERGDPVLLKKKNTLHFSEAGRHEVKNNYGTSKGGHHQGRSTVSPSVIKLARADVDYGASQCQQQTPSITLVTEGSDVTDNCTAAVNTENNYSPHECRLVSAQVSFVIKNKWGSGMWLYRKLNCTSSKYIQHFFVFSHSAHVWKHCCTQVHISIFPFKLRKILTSAVWSSQK